METNKIIIQDSDLDTANAIRSLLSQVGYTVMTIKTLSALESLIVKFKPNLLIIECIVGDNEAKRLLSDLKKNFNIKVIATHCGNNRSYLIENIGFNDCLTKPFNIDDVQQVIRRQLAA